MQQPTQLKIDEVFLNHQRFQIHDDVLYRQVEHEAILLHIPNGAYYSLNETSITFWEALQAQQPLAVAVDQILAEYDIERSQVLQDLQIFLQDLMAFGLIAEADQVRS
ncbi:MAG: PqqD family protein [Myxacorys californica WJT36-NPBG1]|jgi:hypothetical protein|nr:PqqD family protein [Myxacorys californica WJT36-NPBG1]